MKLRIAFVWSLSLVLLPAARAQTVIAAHSYDVPQPVVISSSDSLGITTAPNAVTVGTGATVTFHSTTKIKLEPGFHAASGAHFYAVVGSTYDTDGDGIPDAWEKTHGLDPNNASDASTTTSGGLTNLLEYRLATTPVTSKQTDSGNTNDLKIHRPNSP